MSTATTFVICMRLELQLGKSTLGKGRKECTNGKDTLYCNAKLTAERDVGTLLHLKSLGGTVLTFSTQKVHVCNLRTIQQSSKLGLTNQLCTHCSALYVAHLTAGTKVANIFAVFLLFITDRCNKRDKLEREDDRLSQQVLICVLKKAKLLIMFAVFSTSSARWRAERMRNAVGWYIWRNRFQRRV